MCHKITAIRSIAAETQLDSILSEFRIEPIRFLREEAHAQQATHYGRNWSAIKASHAVEGVIGPGGGEPLKLRYLSDRSAQRTHIDAPNEVAHRLGRITIAELQAN